MKRDDLVIRDDVNVLIKNSWFTMICWLNGSFSVMISVCCNHILCWVGQC